MAAPERAGDGRSCGWRWRIGAGGEAEERERNQNRRRRRRSVGARRRWRRQETAGAAGAERGDHGGVASPGGDRARAEREGVDWVGCNPVILWSQPK